jgi:hypothetical protein
VLCPRAAAIDAAVLDAGFGALLEDEVLIVPAVCVVADADGASGEDFVDPPHVPQPITPPPQSTHARPFGHEASWPQHEPPSEPCPQHSDPMGAQPPPVQ